MDSLGRVKLWALLVVALAWCGGSARAQEYRLGPQDVLSVTVLRHPELSADRLEVDPGGRIRLPFVGSLIVAGKTTSDVTEQIRNGLKKQLNAPTVTVTILQTRPQRVSVSGAVKNPGLLDIGTGWRISEAIAAAGGLTTSPDLASATFSRNGAAAVPVNLAEILRNGGSSENRRLRAGDSLRIVENTVPVRVAGQVKAPGSFDVPRGSSINDAIALAGGFAVGAAQRSVALTRKNGATRLVNLAPGASNNTKVEAGDLIVVAASNDRVTILGAVAKPGDLPLDAGAPLLLSQALVQAGGATEKAALTRATLRRNGQIQPLDLYALTVGGDDSNNLVLQPGDVVTVPEARGVTVYGAVAKPGTYAVEAARAPRVADVIAAAGGLSAPPGEVRIRMDHASVPAPVVTLNAPGANVAGAVAPKRTIGDLLAIQAGRAPGATAPTAPTINAINSANGADANVLNARVYDGDLITVETLKPLSVTVRGEVTTGGALAIRDGETLVDALTRAGGPTGKASLSTISIRHADGTSERADIYDTYVKGTPATPIRLREGDDILVPESEALVYVMGAVQKSGYIAVPARGTLTIGDSLALAGGGVQYAKLSQIGLIRQTPQGVERRVINLNQKNGEKLNIQTPLRAGDVVYVPQGSPSRSTLDTILGSIGVVSLFRRR